MGRLKVILIFVFGLWFTESFGQSCDCPPPVSCGTCVGGFTSLTLRFNGASTSTVIVSDQIGEVYNNSVAPGQAFTFTGSIPNDKFAGPSVDITVNGIPNTTVSSNCAGGATVGSIFGSFTVVAAVSKTGGPLCCEPGLEDAELPVISGCPTTITRSLVSGCTIAVNWTAPTANDNCSIASLTSTFSPGATFGLGTTPVTYTASDPYGNTATCAFNVVVTDNLLPTFTGCPTNISVAANASCQAIVSWVEPVAADNCSIASVVKNHSPNDVFNLGVTPVTYTATDGSGNITTCSFTVTVIDSTVPVFAGCPLNISVVANASCQAIVSWVEPVAADNCSIASVVKNHSPNDVFNLGVTTVTYTATDGSGNITTCSFSVTVTDSTVPVFTGCPTNITVSANASCQAIVSWVEPAATDNCSIGSVVKSHSPNDVFNLGVTTVTYTATDGSGNVATCSFTVTVNDSTVPVFTGCPTNITVSAAANCKAIVNWVEPAATDNCSIGSVVKSHSPNDVFNLGVTPVTYTATDGSGNVATCSFTVTVTDPTVSVFTGCPSNITVSATANCQASVSWVEPVATDNCSVASLVKSHSPNDVFNFGVTTVTYTATDGSGNVATCSFTVTVTDPTVPVFTGCPSNITVSATANCQASVSWVEPVATDNCSIASLVKSHNPNAVFNFGVTTVTYTATDGLGNVGTCSFTVTVTDSSVPLFTNCPSNITVNAAANCKAVATWTPPTANDNCGIASTISSHASGNEFDIGTTTVTYTATDINGLSSTCTFAVTVAYTEGPQVSGCPSNISEISDYEGEAIISWIEPEFTTRCGTLTIQKTHTPGSTFTAGVTEVVYTASDGLGNTTVCTFEVALEYPKLDIQISQLVTPDGDGFNDVWKIINLENYRDNQVTIFDRWGSVLYKASGYDNSSVVWRGTNKSNNVVPSGTYYYLLEISYAREKIKRQGFIELLQ